MIGPTDHIGVAVKDLDAAVARYRALGLRLEQVEEVPSAAVRVAFLSAGGVALELLEPLDPQGTVARYLKDRGEGLHHVAFETDDLGAELARLEREGFELVDRVPRMGSRGRLVAFLHPKSAHGVLIELVQRVR